MKFLSSREGFLALISAEILSDITLSLIRLTPNILSEMFQFLSLKFDKKFVYYANEILVPLLKSDFIDRVKSEWVHGLKHSVLGTSISKRNTAEILQDLTIYAETLITSFEHFDPAVWAICLHLLTSLISDVSAAAAIKDAPRSLIEACMQIITLVQNNQALFGDFSDIVIATISTLIFLTSSITDRDVQKYVVRALLCSGLNSADSEKCSTACIPVNHLAYLSFETFDKFLHIIIQAADTTLPSLLDLLLYYCKLRSLIVMEYFVGSLSKSESLLSSFTVNNDELFDNLVDNLVSENDRLRCASARLIGISRGYSTDIQLILEKSAARIFNASAVPPVSCVSSSQQSVNDHKIDSGSLLFSCNKSSQELLEPVDIAMLPICHAPMTASDFAPWMDSKKMKEGSVARFVTASEPLSENVTVSADGASESESLSSNVQKMCMTATTLQNVRRVLAAVQDNLPILVEGATGVGKSATIMEAARQMGRRLIRFNMSSHITIEDLLGKMQLDSDGNVSFKIQPFTEAWKNGHWILLDECNLATPQVLNCLLGIDTDKLNVTDQSSAVQGSCRTFERHENFRLFATQNPNTMSGRNALPASFVSRFNVTLFDTLPPSEWKQILSSRLSQRLDIVVSKRVADRMVELHCSIQNTFTGINASSVGENGPYTAVSIRDLLKWTILVENVCDQRGWPESPSDQNVILGSTGWFIYGARFRSAAGRAKIFIILWPSYV